MSQIVHQTRLEVRVRPKSRKNQVRKIVGNKIRIHVTQPPVDGKANAALVRMLANVLGVAKSSIVIHRGERSMDKVIIIRGINYEAAMQKLIATSSS